MTTTTMMRSTRATDSATVLEDGRTVRVRVVGWNRVQDVTDDGRTFYREQFEPAGLLPAEGDTVLAEFEHGGAIVGKGVQYDLAEDGLYADVRVADTSTGRDLLALVDEGLVSVSAEFEDSTRTPLAGELVTRSHAVLKRIAFTHVPQHATAAVLGRRSHTANTEETTTVEQTTETTEVVETETTETETTETTETVTRSAPAGRRPSPALRNAPTASRFRSFGDFLQGAVRGTIPTEERARYFRALGVGDTGDIAGLIQDQWLGGVIDLIRAAQPTVAAFESVPLPDKGDTIAQAIVGTRPTVAKQDAEGDAVSSTVATITKATWDVLTYGGGQGLSLQAILRSEPSYLEQVMRLYAVEAALELEEAVVAAALAAADDVHTAVELSNTAKDYQDAFVDAAALILGSAGIQRLPEVAVINVPMWVKLAKAKDDTGRPLFPGVSLMNAQGTLEITSQTGEVRGLRWFVAPKMATANAKAIVGVREAFRTAIGPMQTVQADVPETLSQEHAVFQFAAYGKVDARGLALIQDAS